MRKGSHLLIAAVAVVFAILAGCTSPTSVTPVAGSFSRFDERARAGKHLTVAFFGASLTWGANASDQARTSYRAHIERKLQDRYPKAHFTFVDGAIGGTQSDLGVFRLERDCLRYEPDLVFLDFSANDGVWEPIPHLMASYESLVRRLVVRCPVVQVIFPFRGHSQPGMAIAMNGRIAHIEVSDAYGVPCADALMHIQNLVQADASVADRIWNIDPIHPGDFGYEVFADVAWEGFLKGVNEGMICHPPLTMLHPDTYTSWSRNRISQLKALPEGWEPGRVSRDASNHDWLMSRWLDDVVIVKSPKSGKGESPPATKPLRVKFKATHVSLYGEARKNACTYRALINGKAATWNNHGKPDEVFDPSRFSDGCHYTPLAMDLDSGQVHALEIHPLFQEGNKQELRIESILLAGGEARIVE